MDFKTFITGNRGHELPKELRGFNWGAFILTFIWGYFHKAWLTMLAIPLIFIQLPLGINWALFTALQIYCGIKGNEWAYQTDFWMTPAQFRMKQIKWGAWAMGLSVVLPLLFMFVFLRFVSKSEDNPADLMQNAQCVMTYEKLKKQFIKTRFTTDTTADELAQSFAQSDKDATSSGDTVLYGRAIDSMRVDIFKIQFTKPAKTICKLEEKNCKAESSFTMPDDIFEFQNCVFYFDNVKKIQPDEFTQNALDKGFNILKYL